MPFMYLSLDGDPGLRGNIRRNVVDSPVGGDRRQHRRKLRRGISGRESMGHTDPERGPVKT